VKFIFLWRKIITIPHCLLYIPYLHVYREAHWKFWPLWSTRVPSGGEIPREHAARLQFFLPAITNGLPVFCKRLFCCLYPFLGLKLMKKVGNHFYLTLHLHFSLILMGRPRRFRWNLKKFAPLHGLVSEPAILLWRPTRQIHSWDLYVLRVFPFPPGQIKQPKLVSARFFVFISYCCHYCGEIHLIFISLLVFHRAVDIALFEYHNVPDTTSTAYLGSFRSIGTWMGPEFIGTRMVRDPNGRNGHVSPLTTRDLVCFFTL